MHRCDREKLPCIRGQGQQLRSVTPCPRKRVAAKRSYPPPEEQTLHGRRRAERSYSTSKVRRGGSEEILLFQGKRNPSKTVIVARGHQRADRLKP